MVSFQDNWNITTRLQSACADERRWLTINDIWNCCKWLLCLVNVLLFSCLPHVIFFFVLFFLICIDQYSSSSALPNNISLIQPVITVYRAWHIPLTLFPILPLWLLSFLTLFQVTCHQMCTCIPPGVEPLIGLSANVHNPSPFSLKLLPLHLSFTCLYILDVPLHLTPPPTPASRLPDSHLSPVSPVDDNICLLENQSSAVYQSVERLIYR